jgi:hypothetical protein
MFSLTQSNTTQTQGSGRLGRRAATLVITGGAAAIALLIGANNADAAGNSLRMAQEQHACAVVMGLHQPGDLYDTCIRSLSKTLSELDQARLASTDRGACAQEGHTPGTPAFATCVVNAKQSPADASRYAGVIPLH